jgi:hypothetical protein
MIGSGKISVSVLMISGGDLLYVHDHIIYMVWHSRNTGHSADRKNMFYWLKFICLKLVNTVRQYFV